MSKILKTLLFVLVTFFIKHGYISGQPHKISGQTKGTVSVHQPVDLIFPVDSVGIPDDPYAIIWGATFTLNGQHQLQVPGFYNGSGNFVIRFSADIAGTWTYVTFASIPVLSGQTGILEAEEGSFKGPIMVDPQHPQKFSYADSTSYFALAFELDWLFALDYHNKQDIPKTKQLIGSVSEHGFNQIVMNVYAYDVGWPIAENIPGRYYFGRPEYSVFGGTNEDPDFTTINHYFFDHLDRVIHHLQEVGIVAHIMIYVWNKQVNWPDMYSEGDNRYFDYVIKRYQAYPHVIWDVSKEALDYGRCDIPYINERIQRIRTLDTYQRLVTVHDYEYCRQEPALVDFISIQNWRNDLYSLSLQALERHSDKPVMNIEHGGYEAGPYMTFAGNYTDPETCLVRNYQCVFAGLYSSYYWQNAAWNIVIWDPFKPNQAISRPRFDYYGHLQKLFQAYDYNSLRAYQPKLTTNGRPGQDNFSSSGYPLTNDAGLFLIFVPEDNDQTNVILPEPADGIIRSRWFHPYLGTFTDTESGEWWNWKAYKKPWTDAPAILILDTMLPPKH